MGNNEANNRMIIESGYFKVRRETADYPGALEGGTGEIMYLALGLCSEMVKLMDVHGYKTGDPPVPALGRVAWYMVGLADVAGCVQGLDNILMADVDPDAPISGTYNTLLGVVAAGHIAMVARNLHREGLPNSVASDYPGLVLLPGITRFAKVFRALAAAHDIHPTRILEKNMAIITARQAKGVGGVDWV